MDHLNLEFWIWWFSLNYANSENVSNQVETFNGILMTLGFFSRGRQCVICRWDANLSLIFTRCFIEWNDSVIRQQLGEIVHFVPVMSHLPLSLKRLSGNCSQQISQLSLLVLIVACVLGLNDKQLRHLYFLPFQNGEGREAWSFVQGLWGQGEWEALRGVFLWWMSRVLQKVHQKVC